MSEQENVSEQEKVTKLVNETEDVENLLFTLLYTIEKEKAISAWEWATDLIMEHRIEQGDY